MRCHLCKKRLKKSPACKQALTDRGEIFKAKHFHKRCWKELVLDFMSITH